jgi:hypothetical protein
VQVLATAIKRVEQGMERFGTPVPPPDELQAKAD